MLNIELTDDELELLSRPVDGEGGFQDILRLMKSREQEGMLSVSGTEARKIIRYARTYGQGGFQDRLRALAERLEGMLGGRGDSRA